jgi:acyl-CoA reductase-like NAD-dependent aldehyde dehydrogenase
MDRNEVVTIAGSALDGRQVTVADAPCLIAGSWASHGTWQERIGPFTCRPVSRSQTATPADLERALSYAGNAAAVIASSIPAARAAVLERAAALLLARQADLARLLALELGKPVKDGKGEVVRAADSLAVAAAEARRLGGDVLGAEGWDRGRGTTVLTYRAPVGVVVAITPFNAPVNLLAHKLAASYAAGNTTLVKPPPQAPASTVAFVRLMLEAGMPLEAVQVLHGGAEVGAALVSAREVGAVAFTGSAAAGAAVARAAGPKRLVLELGGNAATIVCDDADLDAAAANCVATGFSNSGQSCISVQRVYVTRQHYQDFCRLVADRAARLRVGDPLDDTTDVGSMVAESAAARVLDWAQAAVSGGAELICGGTRDGAAVQPTIVGNPLPDATVVVEEVFGALVVIIPYDDFTGVLDVCNRSRYGLQAGLFTSDIGRIFQAWRTLQVGGLVVNGSSNFRLDHAPFGGVKDSGMGRESPHWMIEDFTVVKTLLLRGISLWSA